MRWKFWRLAAYPYPRHWPAPRTFLRLSVFKNAIWLRVGRQFFEWSR
jgi:hypothetical protein